jgi:hypothetical protein
MWELWAKSVPVSLTCHSKVFDKWRASCCVGPSVYFQITPVNNLSTYMAQLSLKCKQLPDSSKHNLSWLLYKILFVQYECSSDGKEFSWQLASEITWVTLTIITSSVKHKTRLTVSAAVRLMPRPPARVLNRNTKMSSLQMETNASYVGNHPS